MNKGLEALQKLRDLVEYLTRIDYVPTYLRNQVKELLIKSYKDSNGYFSQIEEALKRNEPMKLKTKRVKVSIDDYRIDDYCPTCDEELYTTSNYCPNCGQKLDWNDDKIELKWKDLQRGE
jgi:hypothetical protein